MTRGGKIRYFKKKSTELSDHSQNISHRVIHRTRILLNTHHSNGDHS